jgi:hypothetical protein
MILLRVAAKRKNKGRMIKTAFGAASLGAGPKTYKFLSANIARLSFPPYEAL